MEAVGRSRNLVGCIALPEAKENWRDGIDLVRSFMEREDGEDEFGGPVYRPAFFVDHSCKNVINEFNNYKAPQSTKGRNVQEIGVRQSDHALDAIRYGLVHLYRLGANRHLAEVINANDRGYVDPLAAMTSNSELSSLVGSGGYFTTSGGF